MRLGPNDTQHLRYPDHQPLHEHPLDDAPNMDSIPYHQRTDMTRERQEQHRLVRQDHGSGGLGGAVGAGVQGAQGGDLDGEPDGWTSGREQVALAKQLAVAADTHQIAPRPLVAGHIGGNNLGLTLGGDASNITGQPFYAGFHALVHDIPVQPPADLVFGIDRSDTNQGHNERYDTPPALVRNTSFEWQPWDNRSFVSVTDSATGTIATFDSAYPSHVHTQAQMRKPRPHPAPTLGLTIAPPDFGIPSSWGTGANGTISPSLLRSLSTNAAPAAAEVANDHAKGHAAEYFAPTTTSFPTGSYYAMALPVSSSCTGIASSYEHAHISNPFVRRTAHGIPHLSLGPDGGSSYLEGHLSGAIRLTYPDTRVHSFGPPVDLASIDRVGPPVPNFGICKYRRDGFRETTGGRTPGSTVSPLSPSTASSSAKDSTSAACAVQEQQLGLGSELAGQNGPPWATPPRMVTHNPQDGSYGQPFRWETPQYAEAQLAMGVVQQAEMAAPFWGHGGDEPESGPSLSLPASFTINDSGDQRRNYHTAPSQHAMSDLPSRRPPTPDSSPDLGGISASGTAQSDTELASRKADIKVHAGLSKRSRSFPTYRPDLSRQDQRSFWDGQLAPPSKEVTAAAVAAAMASGGVAAGQARFGEGAGLDVKEELEWKDAQEQEGGVVDGGMAAVGDVVMIKREGSDELVPLPYDFEESFCRTPRPDEEDGSRLSPSSSDDECRSDEDSSSEGTYEPGDELNVGGRRRKLSGTGGRTVRPAKSHSRSAGKGNTRVRSNSSTKPEIKSGSNAASAKVLRKRSSSSTLGLRAKASTQPLGTGGGHWRAGRRENEAALRQVGSLKDRAKADVGARHFDVKFFLAVIDPRFEKYLRWGQIEGEDVIFIPSKTGFHEYVVPFLMSKKYTTANAFDRQCNNYGFSRDRSDGGVRYLQHPLLKRSETELWADLGRLEPLTRVGDGPKRPSKTDRLAGERDAATRERDESAKALDEMRKTLLAMRVKLGDSRAADIPAPLDVTAAAASGQARQGSQPYPAEPPTPTTDGFVSDFAAVVSMDVPASHQVGATSSTGGSMTPSVTVPATSTAVGDSPFTQQSTVVSAMRSTAAKTDKRKRKPVPDLELGFPLETPTASESQGAEASTAAAAVPLAGPSQQQATHPLRRKKSKT